MRAQALSATPRAPAAGVGAGGGVWHGAGPGGAGDHRRPEGGRLLLAGVHAGDGGAARHHVRGGAPRMLGLPVPLPAHPGRRCLRCLQACMPRPAHAPPCLPASRWGGEASCSLAATPLVPGRHPVLSRRRCCLPPCSCRRRLQVHLRGDPHASLPQHSRRAGCAAAGGAQGQGGGAAHVCGGAHR